LILFILQPSGFITLIMGFVLRNAANQSLSANFAAELKHFF